jgi:hypothetical protein
MSTVDILDEIDALLNVSVLDDYDPTVEVSIVDYANHHRMSERMATNRLEKAYKDGLLSRRMVRNPATHNQIRAYRKPTP